MTATDADTDLPAASSDAVEDFVITENVESELYEATVNGKLAAGLLYSRTGDRVLLLATPVFPEFRGKGVAARLAGGRPQQSPRGQEDRDGLVPLRRRVHPRSSGVCGCRRHAVPLATPRTPPLIVIRTRGEPTWQPSN
ncbi:hypothetical protein JM654_08690 [Microbacterium oxydans]|nr:hypothetical protein [Microbacterium oxydans]